MKVYYYYANQIPTSPDVNVNGNTFFKSLLYASDRFSYMENPNEVKSEYSSFAWYGFEYALLLTDVRGWVGVVTLVAPGGPSDKQGLKRGDVFTTVNGIQINASTESSVKLVLKQGKGVQLQTVKLENSLFKEGAVVTIAFSRFNEMPVYMTRVFNNGSKKVGYIFYNKFDGGQDYAVLDSLAKLKEEGVSELIIDLRYNPGGDVSSAAKIAALLAPVSAEQVFAIYQANANGGRLVKSFLNVINENIYLPQSFDVISSRRLKLERVIFLTTAATASASELLINVLKPYISVTQIGETTIGKDMASFAITDQRIPAIFSNVLHPLIFKLYNAKGKGDYSGGIIPDNMVEELANLPLTPLGDSKDPLISKALMLIGNSFVAQSANRSQQVMRTIPGFSSAEQRSIGAKDMEVSKLLPIVH
ncbi:Carboxyl-terminal protease [Arcticibacter svalbardensis MN12-7]|uniref:Carboxyl-terminal protease n=2 Tax=Arcticibacter TaxID=1288026 RepID=R9GXA0_9SPHI|nr:Carboxyl-terminal protease [Arcticibacter svalbardensis MN12-7]